MNGINRPTSFILHAVIYRLHILLYTKIKHVHGLWQFIHKSLVIIYTVKYKTALHIK